MSVPTGLQEFVRVRAEDRCEYCRMHQSLQGATFHVEHVIPVSRGGASEVDNLAWSCPRCNLCKAARVEVTDQACGEPIRLFNPRVDRWFEHFIWDEEEIVGLTPVGEATIHALDFNHPRRLRIRQAERHFGLFPPE